MSIDTNSMASVLIDTHLDNIQQQQKQDALNYSIFELRATLKEISNEVDKLVQRVEQINTRNGSWLITHHYPIHYKVIST